MNKFNSCDKVVPHSKTITGPSLQSFASFKDCCRAKYIIVSDYKDGVIFRGTDGKTGWLVFYRV